MCFNEVKMKLQDTQKNYIYYIYVYYPKVIYKSVTSL